MRPLVEGLFDVHLTVSDLDGAIAFYREVVGLQLAHVIAAREAALARGVRVNVISPRPLPFLS